MEAKTMRVLYGVYAESEIDDGYGVPVHASVCLFISVKEVCDRYCEIYRRTSESKKRHLIVKEIAPFLMEEAFMIPPSDLTYLDFGEKIK